MRVHGAEHPADGAVLSRRIAALQHDEQPVTRVCVQHLLKIRDAVALVLHRRLQIGTVLYTTVHVRRAVAQRDVLLAAYGAEPGHRRAQWTARTARGTMVVPHRSRSPAQPASPTHNPYCTPS